jgi:hypothetical protein
VRSGTTRVRHRKMAEFALARSGIDAKPQVKPMDPLGRATKIPLRRRALRILSLILLDYSRLSSLYLLLFSLIVSEVGKKEREERERDKSLILFLFYFFFLSWVRYIPPPPAR